MSEEKQTPIGLIVGIVAVVAVVAFVVGKGSGNEQQASKPTEPEKPAEPQEPAFMKEGLVAYYPFNGNAKDESGNGNDGKTSNDLVFTEGLNEKQGHAAFLNGISDPINCGRNEILYPNDKISISAWISSTDSRGWIVSKWNDLSGYTQTYGLILENGEPIFWLNGETNSFDDLNLKAEKFIGDGEWHHVIATWDKMAGENNMKIYIDGVLAAQKTTPARDLTTKSSDVLIGGSVGTSKSKFFNGSIDDVRIYNRALTEKQAKALYEWEKPKAEEPAFMKEGLVAYYPFNGNVKDESRNGNDGKTSKDLKFTKGRNGKQGYAAYLDGHGDSVNCGRNEILYPNDKISISAWISSTDSRGWIVSKWNDTSGYTQTYGLILENGKPIFWLNGWANSFDDLNLKAEKFIGDGEWHHVIATWDKMAGENNMKIYIDGVLAAQKTTPARDLTTKSSDVLIGGSVGTSKSKFFNGSIDDVRIYNRALTEKQAKALYEWEKPKAE